MLARYRKGAGLSTGEVLDRLTTDMKQEAVVSDILLNLPTWSMADRCHMMVRGVWPSAEVGGSAPPPHDDMPRTRCLR
jgi:hypothetical protein